MKANERVDSALHVLKGAVQKVLGAELTTSVFGDGLNGRLAVEYDKKPTQEQMDEVESLANQKIAEDVPIQMIEIERAAAENKYGKVIYDKFPVPSHITKLTLTIIDGWNINCCLGPHVKTTGKIGQLKLRKFRARPARNELEISFELV
ncbi:alanyl-tRNA editing protein [Candidatus Woesearchaeota archaeon]|nr:alanyl-tRNA editing protein [Candidatus Woesearchaeota archaeon]